MNQSGQLSDYWSISPRLINEFRIGFMGEYDLITPQTLGQGYPDKLGLRFGKADVFPSISITNTYGLGPGSPSFANYKENTFDISDQVTLIRGRHLLHFGAAAIIYAARSLGLGSTPMIGFDDEAVHREFGLSDDEIPVMLLSVGPERAGNWPQKPRMPVADVLDFA